MREQIRLAAALAAIDRRPDLSDEQKNQLKSLETRLAQAQAGNTGVSGYMKQLKEELGDTEAMIVSLSQTIVSELSSAMSTAITGLIDGTKTAEEAFADMFKNIGKAFIDMATQMIAKALVLKALNIFSPGPPNISGAEAIGRASFEGGGYTGNGSRTGGVDGKGGFPAILHPQETVIDHTRPDNALIDKLPALPEPEIIDKTIIEQVPLIESISDLVGKIDTEQSSAIKSASGLLPVQETAVNQSVSRVELADNLAKLPKQQIIENTIVQKAADFETNARQLDVPMIEKSFEGGGYTGDNSRVGGLDGRGGFMAMMHPQETVIDHTRISSALTDKLPEPPKSQIIENTIVKEVADFDKIVKQLDTQILEQSFAGGGYTGNAPRVGGLDGQGGFPAMLHPQETVVDHYGSMGRYSNRSEDSSVDHRQAMRRYTSNGNHTPTFLETTVINNVEYATVDQVRAMGKQAAKGRSDREATHVPCLR